MVFYNLILMFSFIIIIFLLLLLGYKSYLHYEYLFKLKKISHWKSLVLFPPNDLGGVLSISSPFFFPSGINKILENKIVTIIKIFWITFFIYFILLFLLLGIYVKFYGNVEGIY